VSPRFRENSREDFQSPERHAICGTKDRETHPHFMTGDGLQEWGVERNNIEIHEPQVRWLNDGESLRVAVTRTA